MTSNLSMIYYSSVLTITIIIITTIMIFSSYFNTATANGQQEQKQLQEDKKDLVIDIEASGKVNQFVVKGQDICKSGNCKYEINEAQTFVTDAPDYNVYFNVDFRIVDEANKDLTPKKREFVEQWRLINYCIPSDIIEKPNGQERYLCINDTIELEHLNSGKSYWLYEANNTYFIPEDKFIANGTLSSIGGK